MEGLNFDNILDEDNIASLFGEDTTEEVENQEKNKETEENSEQEIAEVEPENLFGQPESVGNEKENNNERNEEEPSSKGEASPEFFSSIANAFLEEGLFPDIDEETIKKIKTPQDLRDAIQAQMDAGLNEQQLRVKKCLDNNMEPDVIRQYEGLIGYLGSITNEDMEKEGEEADTLRKRILYQDYLNKGFSKERAAKEVQRSFDSNTEMEDAKEALKESIDFYQNKYKEAIKEAEERKTQATNELKEKAARIKKAMLDTNNKLFGDVDVDKAMRQKAYDAISKPIYKDPETGEMLTALQKLEHDNNEEFMTKLGLLYALTDGFTSIGKVVNKKVKQEVKKGFSELERKINNTARDSYGNIQFASGLGGNDPFGGVDLKLDV